MPKSNKKLAAIEALAAGDSRHDVQTKLAITKRTIDGWMKSPDFVELVDQRHAELAREYRWMLMRFALPALAIMQKGVTGTARDAAGHVVREKVTVSEQKICAEILATLGIITTDPIKPLPPGDYEVKLGSVRPKDGG